MYISAFHHQTNINYFYCRNAIFFYLPKRPLKPLNNSEIFASTRIRAYLFARQHDSGTTPSQAAEFGSPLSKLPGYSRREILRSSSGKDLHTHRRIQQSPENCVFQQSGLVWRFHPRNNFGEGFYLVSTHVLLETMGQSTDIKDSCSRSGRREGLIDGYGKGQ